jgi:hypothetical protein
MRERYPHWTCSHELRRGRAVAPVVTMSLPAYGATDATDTGAQMSGIEPEMLCPNKPHRSARSRYVPQVVLREVYARDGAQCTFTSPAGHRCSERGNLEVHHVRAFALGGEATVDNLKLLCRGHNGFFADKDFGAAHMRMKRALPRKHGDQRVLWDG